MDKKVNNRVVDVIVGGPPCQGFSLTGARDSHDKRNQLFRSMFLAIDKYQPKVVVIENVPGLQTLYGGYYYNEYKIVGIFDTNISLTTNIKSASNLDLACFISKKSCTMI